MTTCHFLGICGKQILCISKLNCILYLFFNILEAECYVISNGADYRGHMNTTESGDICVTWQEDQIEWWPTAGLEGHNYCRNPNQESRPWCYTVEGYFSSHALHSIWDWCEVVEAQDSCVGKFGKN